jgi:hypothetical protein
MGQMMPKSIHSDRDYRNIFHLSAPVDGKATQVVPADTQMQVFLDPATAHLYCRVP